MLQQKYDNTYLGASKIRIEIAKIRSEIEEERSRTRDRPRKPETEEKDKKVVKSFQNYKKIIQEQVKKSWDDLIIPQQPPIDEPE